MKEDKALKARLAVQLRELDMRIAARMQETQPDVFQGNSQRSKNAPESLPVSSKSNAASARVAGSPVAKQTHEGILMHYPELKEMGACPCPECQQDRRDSLNSNLSGRVMVGSRRWGRASKRGTAW
jgi:hypothetical protein